MMLPCDGLVLAGGRSRRMGRSKSDLLMPDGRTLLQRARDTLETVSQGTVWISRPWGYPCPSDQDLTDRRDNPGPLDGIAAALVKSRHSLVAVLAVDLPAVSAHLYFDLYQEWLSRPHTDIVYPRTRTGDGQPLAALWHCRTRETLERFLALPRVPAVHEVLASLDCESVTTSAHALVNVNTPEEWGTWLEGGSQ